MFGIFRGRKKEDREYYCLLKKIFGLRPNNIELYKLALLHRSASQYLHDGTPINNERLEFLGDAVIESVVSDYLFVAFPHENEGFLTQMRSRLVNRAALNELCREIGLSDHICSNASGGVMKNINGDAFEAMVGAMYLDKGYDYTNRTLIRLISNNITLDEVRAAETDFKSRLIEWCQKRKHHIRFTSRFENSAGKNGQVFRSAALIDGAEVGYGLGASKKEAEQHAAYSVLQALDDNMGDMILEPEWEEIAGFGQGLIAAKQNGRWGFVDISGTIVIPFMYDDALPFMEDYAVVTQGSNAFYIDMDGDVVSPLYEEAHPFAGARALVKQNGKFGYIDPSFQTVVRCVYDNAFTFEEGVAVVVLDGQYQCIDEDGNELTQPMDDLFFNEGGYILMLDGGYWGLYDLQAEGYIIAPQYDNMRYLAYGLLPVYLEGEGWMFVDLENNVIPNGVYDDVLPFSEGVAAVEKDELAGLIDEEGHIVAALEWDNIRPCSYGMAMVERDGLYGYLKVTKN